jgi:replicative DNA helicase
VSADLCDLDAERSALAVVAEEGRILGAEHARRTLESTGLTVEDFTDSTHRAFFLVTKGALERGQALVASVYSAETVRGFLPVLEKQADVSRAQLDTLAERLRELSVKRQVWEASRRLTQAAVDPGVPAATLMGRFAEEQRGLSVRGTSWTTSDDAVDEAVKRIHANQEGTGAGAVRSGFAVLDEITGGFPPTLCVILGLGGVAKTAVALSCIRNMCRRGEVAALFAMEDGAPAAAFRWLAYDAGVAGFTLKYSKLNGDAWDGLGRADGEVRAWPAKALIDGRPRLRPNQVLMAAGEAVRKRKAKAVWLDNMKAMRWSDGARMDLEIENFLTDARALAISEGVPFIVLAHTKPTQGSKPGDIPRLLDCREAPGAFDILTRVGIGIGREPDSRVLNCAVVKNTDGRANVQFTLRLRESAAMLEEDAT